MRSGKNIARAAGGTAALALILVTSSVTRGATADTEPRDAAADSPFKVNVNGMTYGSGLDATSPETEPVLLEAIGTKGELGYVYSADLVLPGPSTPEEALARQEVGTPSRTIPLFAVDGTTIIGSFFLPAPTTGTEER